MTIDKDGRGGSSTEEERYVLEVEDEPSEQLDTSGKKVPKRDLDDDDDDDGGGDRRLSADQRDDDDDIEPLEGESEEDTIARRAEARRQDRRRNRDRRRRKLLQQTELANVLANENRLLKERLQAVEERFKADDSQSIEWHARRAQEDIARSEAAYKKAVEEMDGETAVRAQRLREDAYSRLNNARAAKAQMDRRDYEERQRASQPAQVDPRVQQYGVNWMKENSDWFDPTGRDEDSAIALAIDRAMTEEGKDPTSRNYWLELDRRVRKRLPHVFDGDDVDEDDDADQQRSRPTKAQTRSAPAIGGRGSSAVPASKRGGVKVTISPDRKRALEDLGVWGDEEAMKPFLQRYADYDRTNKTR
jgi:hypothetical protein